MVSSCKKIYLCRITAYKKEESGLGRRALVLTAPFPYQLRPDFVPHARHSTSCNPIRRCVADVGDWHTPIHRDERVPVHVFQQIARGPIGTCEAQPKDVVIGANRRRHRLVHPQNAPLRRITFELEAVVRLCVQKVTPPTKFVQGVVRRAFVT